MVPHESTVCMFCGEAIDPEDELLRLNLEAEWTDGSAVYWCHGPCLGEATHSSIPLYVLSLRRDAAVFGQRVDRDQELLSLLGNCIRREPQTAGAIHDFGLGSEILDQLADGVLNGIDQPFTFDWRPRWAPEVEPYIWAEGGRRMQARQPRYPRIARPGPEQIGACGAHRDLAVFATVATERDDWTYGARHYAVTLASTPETMDLELDDVGPSPSRGLLVMASRDDESGTITVQTFTSDPLPVELIERFVSEARRRLPPA